MALASFVGQTRSGWLVGMCLVRLCVWGSDCVWLAAVVLPDSDEAARANGPVPRARAVSAVSVCGVAAVLRRWLDECCEDSGRLVANVRASLRLPPRRLRLSQSGEKISEILSEKTYEEGEGEGEERARQRIVQRPSTTYEFVYDGDEQANRATTTVSIHAFRSHI